MMSSSWATRLCLGALVLGYSTLSSGTAHADEGGGGKTQIALDLDWAKALDGDANGGGGAIRLGYELDLVVLTLIPEIGGSYHSFSDADTKLYRGFVGGRLRFAKVLEPGIYAHLGIGRADVDRPLRPSWTAGTSDFGLLLDFTLLPVIEFGAHAGYAVQFGTDDADSFDWWNAGLHGALVF
jgi:hypothetical protein